MKEKFFIVDTNFSHCEFSSLGDKPLFLEWDRENIESYDTMVLTDLKRIDEFSNKKVYGWIMEPPHYDGVQYEYAKKEFEKFEKIFTFDKRLLRISEKFEYLPIGGCWIPDEEKKIYQKNKLVSMVVSFKKMTVAHNFRHKIVENISNVDILGNGYCYIENKIDSLKAYMFSIVVENQKMDYFFSEKLIDCFVTGTIPIYYGCPSINRFFDIEGILTFDNLPELLNILKNIDFNVYNSKIESVRKNFEIAKNYVLAENHIYTKIKK